jgi:hypothetical protein
MAAALLGALTAGANFYLRRPAIAAWLAAADARLPAAAQVALCVALLLLALRLLAPLRVGRAAWFLSPSLGVKRRAARVAFWLRPARARRALVYVFALGGLKLLWLGVYLAPGGFLLGGTLYTAARGQVQADLFAAVCVGSALMVLVGAGFYAVTAQRYFLVIPILACRPQTHLGEALKFSTIVMDGHCLRTLLFKLSFAPWVLSCLLLLPALWAVPYYNQARACREAAMIQEVLAGV